ncbi:MAG: DUF21 domain-containing protein [Bdellovibrionales bacterium]|nr:DUF21 domain-containing protein [Bdellovibrionales bacterium]
MSTLEIVLCALCILGSAFLASAEIAMFSLSRFQIRAMRERFRAAHRRVKRLLSDPGGFLVSVLVLAEIFNVSLGVLIAESVNENWPALTQGDHLVARIIRDYLANLAPTWALQTLVGVIITSPFLLIACEITPKTIGARTNQLIATVSSGPMTLIYDVLKPIRLALQTIIGLVARTQKSDDGKEVQDALLKEEEFLTLVEEGHREGTVQETELELIKNVFELDDTPVSELMTPIEQVLSFQELTPCRSAFTTLQSRRFSRIPIISLQGGIRRVVGILYSKDLLIAKLENDLEVLQSPVTSVMRKPMTTAPTARLNSLFLRMKKQRLHMAIVEDSDGRALGVVTMNDLLEALFDDLTAKEDDL